MGKRKPAVLPEPAMIDSEIKENLSGRRPSSHGLRSRWRDRIFAQGWDGGSRSG